MKSLVVFYSRSGSTKKVGEAVAKELGSDLEELVDLKKRGGPIGFIRSGRDASGRKLARINSTKYDPSQYDLVIICTPVWAANITPAARTYLTDNKEKIKDAAFLLTFGGRGGDGCLSDMKQIYGRDPRGTLMVRQKEISSGEFAQKIKQFASQLAGSQ